MLSFTYEGLSHISKKKQTQELGLCRNQDSSLLLKRLEKEDAGWSTLNEEKRL